MKKRKAVLTDELYEATSFTSLNSSNDMEFEGYFWESDLYTSSPQLLFRPSQSDSGSNNINSINNDNNNDNQTEQEEEEEEEEMDIRNSTQV